MSFEILKMSALIGILASFWLVVDVLWQRTFATRTRPTGCHGCGCAKPCHTRAEPKPNQTGEK